MRTLIVGLMLVAAAYGAEPTAAELQVKLDVQTARVAYYEAQLLLIAQKDVATAALQTVQNVYADAKAKCETAPGRTLNSKTLACDVTPVASKEADPLETDK